MLKFANENDEVATPKPSATVIAVRDGPGGIEALLLQRNPELAVMGGAWVFPGGKVEADDPGSTDLERSRHAAARELREEAGLEVPLDALTTFSHWLTPVIMKVRFSTWFFLWDLAGDPPIQVDGSEIVASRWITASDALAQHQAGELPLPPPTLVSLIDISDCASLEQLRAMVTEREPPRFFPKVIKEEHQMTFLYPGDAGYDAGDPSLNVPKHRSRIAGGLFSYHRDIPWDKR